MKNIPDRIAIRLSRCAYFHHRLISGELSAAGLLGAHEIHNFYLA
jgi:hypothetical protein